MSLAAADLAHSRQRMPLLVRYVAPRTVDPYRGPGAAAGPAVRTDGSQLPGLALARPGRSGLLDRFRLRIRLHRLLPLEPLILLHSGRVRLRLLILESLFPLGGTLGLLAAFLLALFAR